jgi:hypothetical protein
MLEGTVGREIIKTVDNFMPQWRYYKEELNSFIVP